jgi:hypothetical protein
VRSRFGLAALVFEAAYPLRTDRKRSFRITRVLRKPDGATACGLPVLDGVSDNLKADPGEQRSVFSGTQAGMIEGIASIFTDRFAVIWPAIEH